MQRFKQYRFKYEEIIKYLKQHNISKTKFCKLCNISINTLNSLLKGSVFVNAFAGNRVANILKINLLDLVIEVN